MPTSSNLDPGVFRLILDTSNAAFGDAPGQELARILTRLADTVRDGIADEGRVRDVNGNTVGSWLYQPEDPDASEHEHSAQGNTWAELLDRLPTLTESQTLDLKVDTGELRVWLARTDRDDGEPFDRTVYVEQYTTIYVGEELRDRWTDVGHYDGDERDPAPWPIAAADAYQATLDYVQENDR